jgi:hypothetical protein
MRIAILILSFYFTTFSYAQTNTYPADLARLKFILQKTPSYKAQIKGDKLSYFKALYDRLASDTTSYLDSYKYFYNLAQLLFPLRDNHLGFYQLPDYKNFRTKQSIDSFIATKEFLNYPACNINIDSLKIELAKKSSDSLEGVYHYDTFYTVGLFKNGDNEYVGGYWIPMLVCGLKAKLPYIFTNMRPIFIKQFMGILNINS